MGFNVQFNSYASDTSSIFRLQTETTLLDPQETQETQTSDSSDIADVVDISSAAALMSIEESTEVPLSDTELDYLYSIYLSLGEESEYYGRIGDLVNNMTGDERTNFLETLSNAGDQLEEVITMTESLDDTDRSMFLDTTARLESEEDLASLITAVSKTGGETRSDFLETADKLNRTSQSIKAGELENFITAAANSPKAISALTAKTSEMEEEEELRKTFLTAAASSDEQLDELISVTNTLQSPELNTFLSLAANAGQGISNLITLTSGLSGNERSEFLSFGTDLDTQDLENFLVATNGKETDLSRLTSITQDLTGQTKSQFLEVAASMADSLSPLLDFVQKSETKSGELDNFLSAAQKAGDNASQFLDVVDDLTVTDLDETLSFAANLSFSDMASFIQASQNNDTKSLVSGAEQLSGQDKSYFLYAASISGDVEGLVETLDQLGGLDESGELGEEQKSDFLFKAANIDPESTTDWDTLLEDMTRMEDWEREDYLTSEKLQLTGDGDGADAEYVYLNAAFDEKTMDAILGATSQIDETLEEIDELDNDQRTAFLAVAAKAGSELMPELLDVTNKLEKEASQNFIKFAQSLDNKDLENFISAAQTALDGSEAGDERLSRIMEIAQELDDPVQEDFLNAAASTGTGSVLDGFMDLTEKLGKEMEVDFLIASSNIADDLGEEWIDAFVQGTENSIERSQKIFASKTSAAGNMASSIFLENSILGSSSYRMQDYIKSAAWESSNGLNNTTKMNWISSYL